MIGRTVSNISDTSIVLLGSSQPEAEFLNGVKQRLNVNIAPSRL